MYISCCKIEYKHDYELNRSSPYFLYLYVEVIIPMIAFGDKPGLKIRWGDEDWALIIGLISLSEEREECSLHPLPGGDSVRRWPSWLNKSSH